MSEPIDQRIRADSTGNYPKDGLRYLLGSYAEESDERFYDCEAPLESAMRQMRTFRRSPQRGRDELAELLSMNLSDWELSRRTIGGWLPVGRSTHEFLRYLLTRVDAELAHPSPLDADIGSTGWEAQPIIHRSRFQDKATADNATTLVLRANEQRFRTWAGDQAGVHRLWLAADLGQSIGWVTPRQRQAARERQEPHPEPIDVSTCVTVLRMDPDSGRPVVLTSYPELPLDPAVRERWPDLTALFGGFFNQDVISLSGSFMDAERDFHDLCTRQAVAAVSDALGQLLATRPNHDELKTVLHSLGSCTLPDDTVRWVTGLRRRMIELDWHATPVFPTRDDLGKPGAPPLPSDWTFIPMPPAKPTPPDATPAWQHRH